MEISIASWNVNSVNARLDNILDWFAKENPDIACLQELKTIEEKFPFEAFADLGYNTLVHGQKSYNGVAILSKFPLAEEDRSLPELEDDQARYLQAIAELPGEALRVACIYLPNGNPAPGPKYDYKLSWMDALNHQARRLLAFEEKSIIAGDFNIIPGDDDVYDPAAWEGDALTLPASREVYRHLLWQGWQSAWEQADGAAHSYTYWDYQRGAWQKDHGIRIDHILLSPQAADSLSSVKIHRTRRAPKADLAKPSDHVPIVANLKI